MDATAGAIMGAIRAGIMQLTPPGSAMSWKTCDAGSTEAVPCKGDPHLAQGGAYSRNPGAAMSWKTWGGSSCNLGSKTLLLLLSLFLCGCGHSPHLGYSPRPTRRHRPQSHRARSRGLRRLHGPHRRRQLRRYQARVSGYLVNVAFLPGTMVEGAR